MSASWSRTCLSFAVVAMSVGLVRATTWVHEVDEVDTESVVQRVKQEIEKAEKEVAQIRDKLKKEPRVAAHYEALIEQLLELGSRRALLEVYRKDEVSRLTYYADESDRPEIAECLKVAREWVTQIPDEPAGWLRLAELLDKPSEKEEIIAKVLKKWPDESDGVSAMVELMNSRGERSKGISLAEAFLASHAEDPDAYRVVFEASSREPRRHREVLDMWLARFPDDTEALLARFEEARDRLSPEELFEIYNALKSKEAEPTQLSWLCYELLQKEAYDQCLSCIESLKADSSIDEETREWLDGLVLEAYVGMNDLDKAESMIGAMEQASAEEMRVVLAASAAEEGDCSKVIRLTEPLVGRDIENEESLLSVIRLRVDCGDREWALEKLSQRLKQPPTGKGGGRSYQEAVDALVKMGKGYEARAVIESHLKADPANELIRAALDSVLAEVSDDTTRIAHLQEWARQRPESAGPHSALAEIYREHGENAAAIGELESARSLDPEGFQCERTLFDLYLKVEQLEKANRLAKEALAESGERGSHRGHTYMALIAKSQGRIEDALAHYRKAYEAQTMTWADEDYLGIYRDRNDVVSIETILTEQHRKAASAGEAYDSLDEFLARSFGTLDLHKDAARIYRKIIASGEGGANAHEGLGDSLAALKDWAGAEKSYKAALDLDPQHPSAVESLAELYLERKRYKDAVDLLTTAPKSARQYMFELDQTLAKAHIGAGDFQAAVDVLSGILEKDPDDYDAAYDLGRAYELQGNQEEARAYYELFFRLTEKYEPKYGADCGCYCEVVELRHKLFEKLATPVPEPASGSVGW